MLRKFRSERIAKRQRRIFWTKFILFWLFLFILIYLFSYISRLEKINISNININGNKVILNEDITEIVNKNIEGNYFWFFPKSNILFYPKSKIEKELQDSFLRIEELVISFDNFHSINVTLVERKPFALYCENLVVELSTEIIGEDMATSTDQLIESTENEILEKEENSENELSEKKGQAEKCYFMDEDAYIYAEAMSFSDNVYFKYQGELYEDNNLGVGPLSRDEVLGKIYLAESTEGQFERINLFIRFLKDINIDVYRLLVKENGDYELNFDDDSVLIFDEKQNFDILLEDLQAVLIDLGEIEDKKFEYIDLRFDNKVLYKFKGESLLNNYE